VRATQVELEELVADDFGAALRGVVAGELFIEEVDPPAIDFFGFGGGLRGSAEGVFHTDCTIHHGAWVYREAGKQGTGNREQGTVKAAGDSRACPPHPSIGQRKAPLKRYLSGADETEEMFSVFPESSWG
jgi:hypothetical protein